MSGPGGVAHFFSSYLLMRLTRKDTPMNDIQKALQDRRAVLLADISKGNYEMNLWKLNYLFALHFWGGEEPDAEDILKVVSAEQNALYLAATGRILEMLHELPDFLECAAKSMSYYCLGMEEPLGASDERLLEIKANTVEFCRKREDDSLADWAWGRAVETVNLADLRDALDVLVKDPESISQHAREDWITVH
jgi:hypothetical protein